MWSWRFGPICAAHGAVFWQNPPRTSRPFDRRAVVPVLRPALLEAAVDVPAEVVEGRRDDGDREDVLHRRRHDVLASRGARLVRHEADVDQPHDHDGPEVELLGQDLRVERDLLLQLLRQSVPGRATTRRSTRSCNPPPRAGTAVDVCGDRMNRATRFPCPTPADVRGATMCVAIHRGARLTAARPRPSTTLTRKLSVRFGRPSESSTSERTTPQYPRTGMPRGT